MIGTSGYVEQEICVQDALVMVVCLPAKTLILKDHPFSAIETTHKV